MSHINAGGFLRKRSKKTGNSVWSFGPWWIPSLKESPRISQRHQMCCSSSVWFDLLSQPRTGASTTFLVVVCSLFTNTNCSHKVGLQVQRNTLINNTMYITKRYKSLNLLVLTITLCWSWCLRLYFDLLLTNNHSHMGSSGLPNLTLSMKLTHDSALRAPTAQGRTDTALPGTILQAK